MICWLLFVVFPRWAAIWASALKRASSSCAWPHPCVRARGKWAQSDFGRSRDSSIKECLNTHSGGGARTLRSPPRRRRRRLRAAALPLRTLVVTGTAGQRAHVPPTAQDGMTARARFQAATSLHVEAFAYSSLAFLRSAPFRAIDLSGTSSLRMLGPLGTPVNRARTCAPELYSWCNFAVHHRSAPATRGCTGGAAVPSPPVLQPHGRGTSSPLCG
ncbi:hypothetical protein T492DRAFT_872105 [Pavlovales sp. CCMP2436]|nr:hypothetical protein T492DRAFT_872105 [Pavlovales sp. CCMP2436]